MKGASDGLERLKRWGSQRDGASPVTRASRLMMRRVGTEMGAQKARDPVYPIARQCVFVRHACSVEDLPSRSRKGDYHSAGQ